MDVKLVKIYKDLVVLCFKICPSIRQDKLRKITKTFNQNGHSHGVSCTNSILQSIYEDS